MVAPNALAGGVSVRDLNAYVTAEFARLVLLGFDAGEDFAAQLPDDATEVRWAVAVHFRIPGRGTRMVMPSDVITGRNEDGTPVYPRRTRAAVLAELAGAPPAAPGEP